MKPESESGNKRSERVDNFNVSLEIPMKQRLAKPTKGREIDILLFHQGSGEIEAGKSQQGTERSNT